MDPPGVHPLDLAAGGHDLRDHRPGIDTPALDDPAGPLPADVHRGFRTRDAAGVLDRAGGPPPPGGSPGDGPGHGIPPPDLGPAALAGLLRRGPGLSWRAGGLSAGGPARDGVLP